MGEGTGARRPTPPPEEAPLDAALARIVAVVASAAGPEAVAPDFARAVLRRAAPHQLELADPAPTAAAVLEAFRFVDGRPPAAIHVRVVDAAVSIDGWRPAGTIVEVSCDDRQFIVASVEGELERLGHKVVRNLHPVYGGERGPDGRLTAVVPARGAARRESFVQVELGERVPVADRRPLVDALVAVLGDVVAATDDYGAMRAEVERVIAALRAQDPGAVPADEVEETAALLEWLLAGNFVLVGSCRIEGAAVAGALGVLARPGAPLREPGAAGGPPSALLRIARSAVISRVYRQVPLHLVEVALPGAGDPAALLRLVGLFTRKANAEPPVVTPVLRFKLRRILELEDVVEGSQDEVALVSLFQVLPKDELFEADVSSLRHTLLELLAGEQQGGVRVLVRVAPASRTVSALLSVPAEVYSARLRHRLERFLMTELDGLRVDVDVAIGDRPEAVVRLLVHLGGAVPEPPFDGLERQLRLLCRTWEQELAAELVAAVGEGRGTRLAEAWADWFPASYRDGTGADRAVEDVLELDRLLTAGETIRIVLRPDRSGRAQARLKVFTAGTAVDLSRFLPLVESLGLWAVEDVPVDLGGGRAHLHDFGVTDPSGSRLEVGHDGPRLADAALALWDGRAEVDSLNRLVLRSPLTWDDVAVLRAYRRYRSQVGTAFTTAYVDSVLVEHAGTATALVALFAARFDPELAASPELVAGLRAGILRGCDAVSRLDHDRILRGFVALVDATVRTNRYLGDRSHLALKFDSAAVPDTPRPAPFREIFVHGPFVEGVHLRWGPVARGGIRWSDRPDDYRTEVLDLMRTQVLKNAVIVPTGAKGGFVVKRADAGEASASDVQRAYELFVTSMLDVTDNVVGDHVVPVPRRLDDDDPYLVVAADRGTAAFSDLANRLSERRGFWLGDAFASGGSTGYDHKRLGITARGAWVAVRHHLAELDVDMDADEVTVVGIGDMSGDVFGNAMLQSARIRLVAAFDHRDVFLDPAPDPAVSHAERARLFALPGSSWQDYDRTVVSPGGGVWSRLQKRIPLSDQARALLRVDEQSLTSAELIRAILQAPVTLLFAGGIGTFVRASTEPDHEIDDRANTDVRVEGSSVRARVVGEGANLALTQRARVEYARRGGHLNTDAIDNAAGVDISDHEVNLKILLRPAVEAGGLSGDQRRRVLEEACDDVVDAVLHDCALQSVALSRAKASSPRRMEALESLLGALEGESVLDRAVEALPDPGEMQARAELGAGLTRPELAVLLAGAKRSLAARLLSSPVPDQPALRAALVSYFPGPVARRFDQLLGRHRLARELIASVVANEVVNRMDATFVTRLSAETGAAPPAVTAAYWVAREVVDAPGWWRHLDEGGRRLPVGALVEAGEALSGVLEALSRDYLRREETADVAATVARDRPAMAELAAALPSIGTPQRRRRRARRAEALAAQGLDPGLAAPWACLEELEIGPDACDLARRTGRPVTGVAEAMMRVAEALGVDRLVDRLRQATPADRWSRAAWRGLVDDLDELRRQGAQRALDDHPADDAADAVVLFLAGRAGRVGGLTRLLRDIESEPEPRLDAVAVATRAVRRVLG